MAYAHAMRCPVLRSRMVLGRRNSISKRLSRYHPLVPGLPSYALKPIFLRIRSVPVLSAYEFRCHPSHFIRISIRASTIVLRICYAMAGTDLAYAASRRKSESMRSVSSYARPMQCPVLTSRMLLRGRYAISGTDLANSSRCLPTGALCNVRS
eukprot:3007566-Rhodomonas_salina.6